MTHQRNMIMTEDNTELILGVEKHIWLATTGPLSEPRSEIIGWTTEKPKYDKGFINKGSVLIFTNISPKINTRGYQPLEFMVINTGSIPGYFPADFLDKEIDSLTKEGTLKLLELENIQEMSIALGNALIKYFDYIPGISLSFDAKVLSPRDLYIVMGPDEMKLSKGKITTGEKISLRHILEIFSIAVGEDLILIKRDPDIRFYVNI